MTGHIWRPIIGACLCLGLLSGCTPSLFGLWPWSELPALPPDLAQAVAIVRDLARQTGCAAAEELSGNDLPHLKQVVERWKAGGALELTVLRDDDTEFEFDVTRCRFAELYHRLGIADLGPLLSCNRDGAMIEGFNPDIEFRRTQTIMQGAGHCDFRYRTRTPTTTAQ